MNKLPKLVPVLAYLYLTIPILIFFVGWCNIPTAIIGSIVILISLFFTIKNAPKLWIPKNRDQLCFVALLFLVAFIWVYLSGIGGLVYQNLDHMCRNPLFEVLVSKTWPVTLNFEPAILTYYIAFWLPSAVIGKIFNSAQIGFYFQMFWATLGIFLFFYYVVSGLKKKNLLPIIIFIFFSGIDIIGLLLKLHFKVNLNIASHIEWWSAFQYSSMTTQLFWVFNQAIASWLIVPMLIFEKNNKSIIFLYSCLFLHATLPAIGILPFVIYWCLKNGENKILLSKFKQAFLNIFTFQNIVGGVLIFIVSYLYLSANIAGGNVEIMLKNLIRIPKYFLFEVGIFLFIISTIYWKKPLYYLTFVCLFLYPVVVVGNSIDFCMRASIPALVLLYLMIARAITSNYFVKKLKPAFIILVFFLLLGAATPTFEFARTIIMTTIGVTKPPSYFGFDNFFGYIEGNKFIKYFGKKPDINN